MPLRTNHNDDTGPTSKVQQLCVIVFLELDAGGVEFVF